MVGTSSAIAEPSVEAGPLSQEELDLMDAYWRAANYLSVGQIYLYDNPLLKQPLTLEDIKPRLLGHWGTTPGLNFIYVHLNRVIKAHDLDMIFVCGPGHGGPAMVANTYLEGRTASYIPNIPGRGGHAEVLQAVLVSRAASPATRRPRPRAPSTKAANWVTPWLMPMGRSSTIRPDRRLCGRRRRGGDRPLAAAWHSNKFLNPARDGAVLPILHLNGYKIANPTVLARISHEELEDLIEGYGYKPYFVEGSEPAGDAPEDGGDTRYGDRRDQADSARGPGNGETGGPTGR